MIRLLIKVKFAFINCYKKRNKKIKTSYNDGNIIRCEDYDKKDITKKICKLNYIDGVLNTKIINSKLGVSFLVILFSVNGLLYNYYIDLINNIYTKTDTAGNIIKKDEDILFNIIELD